jgi:hypothetical protein
MAITLAGLPRSDPEAPTSLIVQGNDLSAVRDAVLSVGGEITHELGLIDAVAARLTQSQLELLEEIDGVSRFYGNAGVEVAGKPSKPAPSDPGTIYPTRVAADLLHAEGTTGAGVTVAVLDSGWDNFGAMSYDTQDNWRVLESYDAIQDVVVALPWRGPVYYPASWGENDTNGHSTHITSIILSRGNTNPDLPESGLYHGIAPDANLVVVKAFDADGQGSYADVIRGIDWIVANKDVHQIRVLNCSFSAPPRSHYWDDPLNQAVMRAWQAGIVVVASAGNNGPDAMTIGVPANVPYVITVGAMSDNYTPSSEGSSGKGKKGEPPVEDDFLASFSSAGPTAEGFVKPDVVAPGGHMRGLMGYTVLAQEHPEFYVDNHFVMSGTSQAAAVVSGTVALMLQREPFLDPDGVKCKLMSSARPAVTTDGSLAYSVFQQGAGLIHARNAVYATDLTCANNGLDIEMDLAGTAHFGGRANQAPDGTYYVMDFEGDGFLWDDAFLWDEGFLWDDAFLWDEGFLWDDGFIWNDTYTWSNANTWNDTYLWSSGLTETMGINVWVPQE